jgi:hypothetical protein
MLSSRALKAASVGSNLLIGVSGFCWDLKRQFMDDLKESEETLQLIGIGLIGVVVRGGRGKGRV